MIGQWYRQCNFCRKQRYFKSALGSRCVHWMKPEWRSSSESKVSGHWPRRLFKDVLWRPERCVIRPNPPQEFSIFSVTPADIRGRKRRFDDSPDPTQDFYLLPYQQCILVTKHTLDGAVSQFSCHARLRQEEAVVSVWAGMWKRCRADCWAGTRKSRVRTDTWPHCKTNICRFYSTAAALYLTFVYIFSISPTEINWGQTVSELSLKISDATRLNICSCCLGRRNLHFPEEANLKWTIIILF